MKGIELPPRQDDFTADPVELFFDLAFVFAFSQLVSNLVHHPDWRGVADNALLFLLLWLPWQQLTWAANAVSGNGRTVRVMFLIGTVASVPMAAATSTALDEGGIVFAAGLSCIFLIGSAMALFGVRGEPEIFRSTLRWNVWSVAALAVLLAGALVDGTARIGIWWVCVAIVFAAMVRAGSGEWIIRTGHFAERHALIIIIALGEVIVALGRPVVESLEGSKGLPGTTVAALIFAGAFAGLTWWGYFDRPGPAFEHRASENTDGVTSGRFVRDVYTWGHMPIVAGIIVSAAAIEEIALHPERSVDTVFRTMLFGGLALIGTGISASTFRSFRVLAKERLAVVILCGAILLLADGWDGVWILAAIDLIIAAGLVAEHARIEK